MPDNPSSPPGPAPEPDEAPTTAGPTAGEPRRLLRSRDDRVVAGVCGGLARYFRIDPLIVRIAAIALAFVGGASVVAYLAAVLLVPDDDGTGAASRRDPSRAATIAGALLLVIAGVALLSDGIGWWWWGPAVPILVVAGLIGLAGYRIFERRRGMPTPTAARIVGATLIGLAVITGAAVAFVGSAWATAAGGGEAIAAIVIALGVAMIVLSFGHRHARWLAVPALILAVPAGVVAAADVNLDGGIGDRSYAPAAVADLHPGAYRVGSGELRLDLRDMEWPSTGPVHVQVDVGVGHAVVLVPDDVCVQSATKVGLGYVNLLGDESGGADVKDVHGTTRRAPGHALVLDAQVGIGALEVLHDGNDELGRPGDYRGNTDSISPDLARAGCAGDRA